MGATPAKQKRTLEQVAGDLFLRYRKAGAMAYFGCHLVMRALAVPADEPGGTQPEPHIVLISERKGKKYSLPGGKGELTDQSPQHVLQREIEEELELKLDTAKLRLVAISSDNGAAGSSYVSLLYETSEDFPLKSDCILVAPAVSAARQPQIAEFTVRHFESLKRAGRL